VAFVVRCEVDELPPLAALAEAATDRLGMSVEPDEVTAAAAARGGRSSSWCPWPHPHLALHVPGASTRGVELLATRAPDHYAVSITCPALGTWADWRLGLALGGVLAGPTGTLSVPGEGEFLAEGLVRHFEDDDQRYLSECLAGTSSVAQAVREGRIARIGGPAGHAAIGPRTWIELMDEVREPEELPTLLIERIQASIEARGYEAYHEANPMWLDGRGGNEILVVVLAPETDTLLRDPEYILVSDDIESDGEVTLWLLPFRDLEAALPGIPRWLDDRTAAMPAISRARWPGVLARMRPMLVLVPELLDRPLQGGPRR
jgi:hypothetical protein